MSEIRDLMKKHQDRETMFRELMAPYISADVIDWLKELGYFECPASTKYHGNYPGGLFDHSLDVTDVLIDITVNMGHVWQKQRSPFIVGTCHDLCKLDLYYRGMDKKDEVGNDQYNYNYRNTSLLPGHAEKSLILIQSKMQLTEEEIMCIRYHMGAYEDKSVWEFYDRAIRKYPNVLWTHTADMYSSKVNGL